MALQIKKPDFKPMPKAKAKKNSDYLKFLHDLPCVITGRSPVEAAHLNFPALEYGHFGRGKGTKAPDRWALPLCAEVHRGAGGQHSTGEREWWESQGIDPHLLALTIFGLWSDMGDDAAPFAANIIRQMRERAKSRR